MVELAERAYFQARAREMAPLHAHWLMADQTEDTPERTLLQAVDLIKDCVEHFDQPELAITLALHYQPFVEQWSCWGLWSSALDLALTAARQVAEPLNKICLLNHRSEAARASNEYEAAKAMALQALELATNYKHFALVAMSLNQLGRIAYVRDRLNLARDYWEQAYCIGEEHCSAVDLGRMTLNIAVVAINQRRFEEAQQRINLANHYFEIADEPVWLAKAQSNLATLHCAQGHILKALPLWQAAAAVFLATDNHVSYAHNQNQIGYAFLRLGHWAEAREHLHAAACKFEQLGSFAGKVLTMSNLINLYVTMEEWAQAEVLITEVRKLAMTADNPLVIAAIDVEDGRMLLAHGDPNGARQLWERVLTVQQGAGAWEAAHKTQQLMSTLPE